jgi:hypothetical protein
LACRAFVGTLPALIVFVHGTDPLTGCLLTGILTVIATRRIANQIHLRGAILRLF